MPVVKINSQADLTQDWTGLIDATEKVGIEGLGQVDLERLGLAHVRWPDELRACLTTRGFADEVRADARDVVYLLEAANAFFPEARLSRDDVVWLAPDGLHTGTVAAVARLMEIAARAVEPW